MNKVYADITITPIGPFTKLADLINLVIPNLMIIAGLVFLIFALMAGFSIIRGAGSADAQKLEQGKKALTFGILGLVLIFSSFFIVGLIEMLTGIKILKPEF